MPPDGASRPAYPLEVRLKAVKLYLEEGLSPKPVSREVGIHPSQLYDWAKRYKAGGESGLAPGQRRGTPPKRSAHALRQKITEVKQQNPSFGVKRISQWLRRVLFLPASPETVRRTLHRQGLMPKTRKKTPRGVGQWNHDYTETVRSPSRWMHRCYPVVRKKWSHHHRAATGVPRRLGSTQKKVGPPLIRHIRRSREVCSC